MDCLYTFRLKIRYGKSLSEVHWISLWEWSLLRLCPLTVSLWKFDLSTVSYAAQNPSFHPVEETNQAWTYNPQEKIFKVYLLLHRICSFWQNGPLKDTYWTYRFPFALSCLNQCLSKRVRTTICFLPHVSNAFLCNHSSLWRIAKCLTLADNG